MKLLSITALSISLLAFTQTKLIPSNQLMLYNEHQTFAKRDIPSLENSATIKTGQSNNSTDTTSKEQITTNPSIEETVLEKPSTIKSLLEKLNGAVKQGANGVIDYGKTLFSKNETSNVTNNTKAASTTDPKAKFLVKGLPDIEDKRLDDIVGYAGQLMIEGTDDGLFFWLVTNKTNTLNSDTLVLWLNGGPGCTSMDGMFLENGPYIFNENKKIVMRDHAWSTLVDVLYIDQPFGTGLSPLGSSGFASNYVDANKNLVMFLKSFFNTFPEYKTRNLYITGESQAGVYLGYLAHSLLYEYSNLGINLKGTMIGNGWIDPKHMYLSYEPLALQNNLITEKTKKAMADITSSCAKSYENRENDLIRFPPCESILNYIMVDDKLGKDSCLNVYDMRLKEKKPSCGMTWPPGLDEMTNYLQRSDVQSVLNIEEDKKDKFWTECSSYVSQNLNRDKSKPSILMFDEILKKAPITVYVGDQDIICNKIGHDYMLGNLTWGGETGFKTVSSLQSFDIKSTRMGSLKRRSDETKGRILRDYPEWKINGVQVGTTHTERSLTYTVLFNASHMTGYDKPLEMLDMLSRFANLDSTNLRKFAVSNIAPSFIQTSGSGPSSKSGIIGNGTISSNKVYILLGFLAIFGTLIGFIALNVCEDYSQHDNVLIRIINKFCMLFRPKRFNGSGSRARNYPDDEDELFEPFEGNGENGEYFELENVRSSEDYLYGKTNKTSQDIDFNNNGIAKPKNSYDHSTLSSEPSSSNKASKNTKGKKVMFADDTIYKNERIDDEMNGVYARSLIDSYDYRAMVNNNSGFEISSHDERKKGTVVFDIENNIESNNRTNNNLLLVSPLGIEDEDSSFTSGSD
ncbi:hypothetical protein BB558_001051 [Smittium angustum]|uniref:Pheromone-processing carboxypeptidase KEX1 n=1 Tax=Smittium angustum TaxID=133377 RepID=A0A2U1JCG7_SMIAN|nr:hypothetical protein BB558_001051 [Smittium angustum]